MKTMLTGIAAGIVLATAAQADQFTDRIVSDLQGKGYDYIEIKEGVGQVKVEAVRGSSKIEVVYDRATGDILKQERGVAGSDDRNRSGVEISTRSRTFVDSGSGGDDDDDDDGDRGRGGHDDDDVDHGGSDHGGGDHGGGDDSDRGGDDDSGGGHDDDDDD